MVEAVTIVLHGVPKGKGRPRFRQGQRRPFTPADTREYEADIGWAARRAMAGRAVLQGAVEIDVTISLPIPESWSPRKREAALCGRLRPTVKPDFDNTLKILGDGCNKIVWRDDAQITDGQFRRRYGAIPGVTLIVRAVELGPSS